MGRNHVADGREKRSGPFRRGCGDETQSASVNSRERSPLSTTLTLARPSGHLVMDWLMSGYNSVNRRSGIDVPARSRYQTATRRRTLACFTISPITSRSL